MFTRKYLTCIAILVFPLSAVAQTGKEVSPTSTASPKMEAPGASTISPSDKAKPAQAKQLSAAEEFKLEMKRCMDAWDAGTSMTKTKWREICHRTLKERLPHRRASSTGTPPPKPSLR